MKVKQKTLQSFEFTLFKEDEEKIFSYISSNEPLLKGNLLILSGENISDKLQEFLKEKEICYIKKECELNTKNKVVKKLTEISLPDISLQEAMESLQRNEELDKIKYSKDENIREVLKKPIRSGTFIKTSNDLIVLNQINSGAEIEVSGNIELFGSVNGRIICNGSYMLVRDIGESGYIIFNGIILERERFKTKKAKFIKLDVNSRLLVEEL